MRCATSSCSHGEALGCMRSQRAAALAEMGGKLLLFTVACEYIVCVLRQLFQVFSRRLPSRCAVCHAWPTQPVCSACVTAFAQPQLRCPTCAITVSAGMQQCGSCILTPPPLDACLAALPYAYPWADLIARFKFRQDPGWATSFALLLRATPWVEPALESADWLLPMPLSTQRLRQRGYNQAHELACALDAAKVGHGLLLRIRDTPPQRSLSRSERMHNVKNAYAVDPLRSGELKGKRVVLLDDVMTTGASLYAAALALREAGAAHITGLVLARTE